MNASPPATTATPGDAQVSVSSQRGNTSFVGIARQADVERYVAGGALMCGLLVAAAAGPLVHPLIRGRRTPPHTGEQRSESRTPVTAGTAG